MKKLLLVNLSTVFFWPTICVYADMVREGLAVRNEIDTKILQSIEKYENDHQIEAQEIEMAFVEGQLQMEEYLDNEAEIINESSLLIVQDEAQQLEKQRKEQEDELKALEDAENQIIAKRVEEQFYISEEVEKEYQRLHSIEETRNRSLRGHR